MTVVCEMTQLLMGSMLKLYDCTTTTATRQVLQLADQLPHLTNFMHHGTRSSRY